MKVFLTEEQLNYILSKSQLKENNILSNNGSEFGNYGWCMIIMGAPGSGKSYFLKNNALINGKIFDIDEFRARYEKLIKNNTGKKPSFKELQTTSGSLLKKAEKNFITAQNSNRLNNIIFDIGGRPGKRGEAPLATEIIQMVKPLGYKVVLLWVVCNRSEAMLRNVNRGLSGERKILPDKSFHQRTNQINKFVPMFLQSDMAKESDMAFITFTSTNGIGPMSNEDSANSLIRLEKTENGGYKIPQQLLQKIENVLGPKEKSNGFTPETYMTNAEIKKYLKSGNNNKQNFLKINENMEEENEFLTEFEEDVASEFDNLLSQLFDLRDRARAYSEVEETSEGFDYKLEQLNWICENYATTSLY